MALPEDVQKLLDERDALLVLVGGILATLEVNLDHGTLLGSCPEATYNIHAFVEQWRKRALDPTAWTGPPNETEDEEPEPLFLVEDTDGSEALREFLGEHDRDEQGTTDELMRRAGLTQSGRKPSQLEMQNIRPKITGHARGEVNKVIKVLADSVRDTIDKRGLEKIEYAATEEHIRRAGLGAVNINKFGITTTQQDTDLIESLRDSTKLEQIIEYYGYGGDDEKPSEDPDGARLRAITEAMKTSNGYVSRGSTAPERLLEVASPVESHRRKKTFLLWFADLNPNMNAFEEYFEGRLTFNELKRFVERWEESL